MPGQRLKATIAEKSSIAVALGILTMLLTKGLGFLLPQQNLWVHSGSGR